MSKRAELPALISATADTLNVLNNNSMKKLK